MLFLSKRVVGHVRNDFFRRYKDFLGEVSRRHYNFVLAYCLKHELIVLRSLFVVSEKEYDKILKRIEEIEQYDFGEEC